MHFFVFFVFCQGRVQQNIWSADNSSERKPVLVFTKPIQFFSLGNGVGRSHLIFSFMDYGGLHFDGTKFQH